MGKQTSAATSKSVPSGGRGEAGRRGDTVRSDVHVEIELRSSGGTTVELESRVEPYYGDSIREQVGSILAAAGVRHASVDVHDQGALPFVIAARVETALMRAGVVIARSPAAGTPAAAAGLTAATARDRLRRSRLYLPGNEPRYFVNAGLHAPPTEVLWRRFLASSNEKPEFSKFPLRNHGSMLDY